MMHSAPLPLVSDVVLIGGGHTHALVLRKWGMNPLPGARLTVINPGPTAPYSGMLPGHVAGHYPRAALDIDLVQLARFAGARIVVGAATGLDLAARRVLVPGRPPIGFDLCSIDVGITSAMPGLPGFDEYGVPAKPLGVFAARWRAYLSRSGPARVAVIGAGVAGAELAMAIAHALRQSGRTGAVSLIDRSAALTGPTRRSRAALMQELAAQGIEVIENAPVARVSPRGVALADGRHITADFVTGAAGAKPHDWIGGTGLTLDNGFVTVDAELRSSDPQIFAVGDCAHMAHAPRPKAGVYAVRQAPVLLHNLRAALTGGKPRRYPPQGDYLKLISLGGKRALADRFGLTLRGRLMWRWKDRIDRKFMDRFRELPTMPAPALPRQRALGMDAALGEKPMCGGCGAKVAPGTLAAALAGAAAPGRGDVTNLPGDDAALIKCGAMRQILTTDHLRAFCNDPVLMARIAAVHALGDVWAMGAAPQAATISLILPRQNEALQARMLAEIMGAATDVLADAGAAIAGGHTTLGDELTIGFALTGLCEHPPITLAGAQPGDALILTKPIGSGVLMAAEMQARAPGAQVLAAWEEMSRAQGAASTVLRPHSRAMTDVTGFGLAGHLLNICRASGCAAILRAGDVPLMAGALELSEQRIRSTLYPANHAQAPEVPQSPRGDLLFDPQTAGGLLAAVDPGAASQVLSALQEAGYPAARIGEMTQGAPGLTVT